METIGKRLKTMTFFFAVLTLIEGCVVYHKAPTTLDKASQLQTKTKITNTTGETFKYKCIVYEGGQYYGVRLESREWIKIPLSQKDIAEVLIENKSASTWASIGLGVVSAPFAAYAIFLLGFIVAAGV
jgi:hypothetical protein